MNESAAGLPGESAENPVVRPAVRVLMLDPDDRILMMRFVEKGHAWWSLTGGGLEPGETHIGAAIREIREETGLADARIGPWIWSRDHCFPWRGGWLHQVERIHLVRAPRFEAVCDASTEGFVFAGLRWWTLDELESTTEDVSPRRLAVLLRDLLKNGPPPEPIDAGV